MARICQMCGTSNDDTTEYCAACGSPLTSIEKPAGSGKASTTLASSQPGRAGSIGAQTVLGMPATGGDADIATSETQIGGTVPNPSSQKTPTVAGMIAVPRESLPEKKSSKPPMVSPSKKRDNRTVMGIAAIPKDSLPEKKSSRPPMAMPSQAPPPATSPSPKKSIEDKKTVLGMRAIGGAIPATKPAPTTPKKLEDKKTVLGMAAMGGAKPAAKPAPASKKKLDDKKTMLGMPAMGSSESTSDIVPGTGDAKKEVAKGSAVTPSAKAGSLSKRTQAAGMTSPVPEGADERYESKEKDTTAPEQSEYDNWPDESEETEGRGPGLLIVAAAAGFLIIIGLIAVIYLFVVRGESGLSPQVFPTADGQAVTVAFSFPEAPPGATLQVTGQTVPVAAGQARIDIRLSELKLGTNNLRAIYTEPGKSPVERSFPIMLRHSVSTDLSGLMGKDPFVLVNFRVAQGIKLAVGGKPVQLSGDAYSHRIPISSIAAKAGDGNSLIHQVSFQLIDDNGVNGQGQHAVVIPVTSLQINRPAADVVVASGTVTCAGMTEEGAQVTVNGEPVGVTAVGFNTSVPLPSLGEHSVKVTARAPGKAPHTESLTVTRIEDLADAISDWSKDLDTRLDYATIGRDPNAHAGKKIKLNGRIVNINTEKGVTAFLLYIAQGCGAGALCAVHGVFRGETEAGLQSWVNVYAVVKGIRTVDLPSGKKLDVPAVEAVFVEKSKRKKGRRR